MTVNPIILISDPEVLKIPIAENRELMVSLDAANILIDRRKIRPESYYRARKAVVAKLLEAQSCLPTNMKLLVVETFRPLYIQEQYFKEYSKKLKTLHPEWNEKEVYAAASKYVAPPENVPPHCTGGAVDLTLREDSGDELDMGTRLNADPVETENACFTAAENISDVAKLNRKILINAMEKTGFVNYPTEWWHWSYGDRYWAYQTKAKNALYGTVEDHIDFVS